ncbi:Rhodanese-related sulfurtransferase [Deinococcus reticulitermitis]|uniref:Rhodanese-related sulfurtransferase n=1 Tax=Deinococcus reticulitermitis TaxID=856736 RepID=A0A1H7AT17_9DEIO|nr:rhodanese-like domain-containing protein [Deinococcus reticulitermitis]SEJ65020.1 Rhodanese-related sulfurtransferase [Deinococcus reticulitermitis]
MFLRFRPVALLALLTACAPAAQDGYTTVSVQDLHTAQQSGEFVLDVRTPAEYVQGHVPGATLLPLQDLPARLNEVPKDRKVYVICRSGSRSAQASQVLTDGGHRNVYNVDGGMLAWEAAGFPTTR